MSNTALRILMTNDDGISSPGLLLLAKALREAGHRVFVLAPDSERSGSSHSISFLNSPCKITGIAKDTWSCSGTPADCVIMALLGAVPELSLVQEPGIARGDPPQLLLSGINRGANLGTDLVYSGTAAAARQGSLMGIPSAALSLVEAGGAEKPQWHWDAAVAFVIQHLDAIRNCWKEGVFVNVNFPNIPQGPSALVPAAPSLRYYNDRIELHRAADGGAWWFARGGKIQSRPAPGSDWDAVSKNQAAISAVPVQPGGGKA